MRKLLGVVAIGGFAWGAKKLAATRKPNTAHVDMDQPQKTVEKVEAAVGEPVRP